MIEVKSPSGFSFEEGSNFPVYLPDAAVEGLEEGLVEVKGDYLGRNFPNDLTFRFLEEHVRIVPELPLNHVIGIPSLEGKIFEED